MYMYVIYIHVHVCDIYTCTTFCIIAETSKNCICTNVVYLQVHVLQVLLFVSTFYGEREE